MKDRPTLAAAIITYNEEDQIAECLASITDLVDEIVVLDSFSTDATEKICRANPKVQFFQHAFDGYIQQKNRALAHCTAEWVVCLDADERVSPELRQSIETFLANSPVVNGVRFPRLTYHLGRYIRHGGWYPNQRYRLVRQGKAYWGGENPHAHLFVEGKTTTLKGDLLHFSYRDLADQVNTINTFSSTTAYLRCQQGKRSTCWRLIGKPIGKFLEVYVFKAGFLDGIQGWIIALSAAYTTLLKEAKLYELDRLGRAQPTNLPASYWQAGTGEQESV